MSDWHRGIADPSTLHRIVPGQTMRISDVFGQRWVWAACGVHASADGKVTAIYDIVNPDKLVRVEF